MSPITDVLWAGGMDAATASAGDSWPLPRAILGFACGQTFRGVVAWRWKKWSFCVTLSVLLGAKNVLCDFLMSTTVSFFFMSRVANIPLAINTHQSGKGTEIISCCFYSVEAISSFLTDTQTSSEQSCSSVLLLTSPAPPRCKRKKTFLLPHTDETLGSPKGLGCNSAGETSTSI